MKIRFFLKITAVSLIIGALFIGVAYFIPSQIINNALRNIAGTFFVDSITVSGLIDKYNNYLDHQNVISPVVYGQDRPKIKILIVPGHEPDYGGAEFGFVKERYINVDLADDLARFLKTDPHYDVTVSRDNKKWLPELEKYFSDSWDSINLWEKGKKDEMLELIADGSVRKITNPAHQTVPDSVATRLYGINKWADEQNFDIVINVHFNDYGTRRLNLTGDYYGFVIYVPERQYSNSKASKTFAGSIFNQLSKYFAVSDIPAESVGVVEDQDLIAIGSYNTVDPVSILVEYGYIYEPQFKNPDVKDAVINEYAYQTFLGIQNFFKASNTSGILSDTTLLPHIWQKNLSKSNNPENDILALQLALKKEGFYPPMGKTKNECPITGVFGYCTEEALFMFQANNGIFDEKGILGVKTREVLNVFFSGNKNSGN